MICFAKRIFFAVDETKSQYFFEGWPGGNIKIILTQKAYKWHKFQNTQINLGKNNIVA